MKRSRLVGGTLPFLFASMMLFACTSSPSPPGGDDDDDDTVGAPTLTSVVPSSGIVTTTIAVEGTSFGAETGTVSVGGGLATIVSWSDTDIVAAVGADSYPGDREITVTRADAQSVTGLSFTVKLPPRVYVNNDLGANSVSAYALDPADGSLTELGDSPYVTGVGGTKFSGDGRLIALHDGTRRLFATNETSVSVFDIDPVTGALTEVAGSPFPTGGMKSFGVTVRPAGDRIVIANYATDDIVMFDVAADGDLTQLDLAVSALAQPDIPIFSPDGNHVYVNSEAGDSFMVYDVGDVLTHSPDSPFNIGNLGGQTISKGFGAAMHPAGIRYYIADYDQGYIWEHTIDAGGMPQPSTSNCGSTGCPTVDPNSMAFNSDATTLFASAFSSSTVYTMDLDTIGHLSNQVAHDLGAGVAGMSSIGVTPDDQYLIVLDEVGGDIHVFALSGSTPAAEVTGSPFAGQPYSGGFGMSGLAITRY